MFPNFFQTFWPQNRVFDSKTQTLRSFFKIFEIDILFWLISELFSKLKFPNFFLNFFAKISQVQKFRFFPKNFRTSTAKHFRNSRKRKVRKILSNTGPYMLGLIKKTHLMCGKTFGRNKDLSCCKLLLMWKSWNQSLKKCFGHEQSKQYPAFPLIWQNKK
jgi:hypothetical protein